MKTIRNMRKRMECVINGDDFSEINDYWGHNHFKSTTYIMHYIDIIVFCLHEGIWNRTWRDIFDKDMYVRYIHAYEHTRTCDVFCFSITPSEVIYMINFHVNRWKASLDLFKLLIWFALDIFFCFLSHYSYSVSHTVQTH